MKKLLFSVFIVATLVSSAIAFRATDRIFCLNAAGTACNVLVTQQALIDRGLGIIGAKQCAGVPTAIPCTVVTIYKGV